MVAHIRVIGSRLKRDIECDSKIQFLSAGDEAAKICQGAQLAVNLFVSAVRRTNGPGAAAVAGLGLGGVVGAFAEHAADGMDGREIDHVEAHLGDVWQALFTIGKRAMGYGVGRRGARKEKRKRNEK